MREIRFLLVCSVLFLMSFADWAIAQPSRGAVELQAPVLAEQNDGAAVAVNPGQIALLRGWNLAYTYSQVRRHPNAGEGHGLYFAMPLRFGLGWGAAIELARPFVDSSTWRSPFTLALAWRYAHRISIGVSSRWLFSTEDPALNGLWAVDLGLTIRLNSFFAVAVTAHSINNPQAYRAQIPSDEDRFGRTWSLGLLWRPALRDYLSLAAEASYAEQPERVTVRGVVALRPLSGWTIKADVASWFEDGENGLSLSVSTELALSLFTIGGGYSVAGLADGEPNYGGFSVAASVSADGHSVAWQPSRFVQITLDDEPSTRSLAALERTLLRAADDPSVRGVLLRPRSGFSASIAELQDIRWIVQRIQRQGKHLACYLDDASGSGYFLCAGADHIAVNVAGGVRLSGLRMTTLYLGDAMERLGVSFEMVRIGEYKGSPEQLTQDGPSETNQEQTNAFLSSIYRRWIWDLAHDRGLDTTEMVQAVDNGPYLAEEAVDAGLIDEAIYADELPDSLEKVFGKRVRLDKNYAKSLEPRRAWPGGPAVAVVHIQGNLSDGEGFEAGPDWFRSIGSKTIVQAIKAARTDRNVKALVLRIDSPGGSVLASDVIWREVHRTRKSMPIIASMGGVAASGGYYVACAAHEIYSAPTTLTGSIGVFFGKFELSALMEKVGVYPFHYRRGKRAGHNDWTRPWTDDEREVIMEKIGLYYDRFLDRVVTGRKNFSSRQQVDAIGRGRIWSGSKAKQLGLVDHIGGLQHAIERAAEKADLGRNYDVIHLPRRKLSLAERAVTWIGLRASDSSALPPALDSALRTAAPLVYQEPNRPQALLPFAFELEHD